MPKHGKKLKKQPAWAKLDNTALLFPVISREGMSSVYRISVTLTEDVIPDLLQQSVEKVLEGFLMFRMRLRMGFFWYYFEENDRPVPKVREEEDFPGAYINKSRNNHYMFRVTYYKKRINLEVFHALTDGYGGLVFLKELVYQYLRLAHPDDLAGEKDRISSGVFMDQEDSYLKNYKKGASHDTAYGSRKALVIKGETRPKGEMGVVHGYFVIDELKAAAKKYGLTINQYLVGNYVYAIYREYLKGGPSKLPISCCVPVDLRARYESHTMKNFFVMIAARFQPGEETVSREEVLRLVAENLKEQMDPKNLDNILSYNVSNEQNAFLRPIPIFIKNIAIRHVYMASADTATSTMTNVGNVELKEPYRKYVEHFYAMLAMSRGQNIKGAIVSYGGTLVVTFTSCLTDLSIQKRFFQSIAKDGAEAALETNEYIPEEGEEEQLIYRKKKKEKKEKSK
ncbi:MAG: hypothetical protein K6E50_04125 [Lachnospiraceae bacterium]|nr:hypothetical protein [Lachnospiraceae bacterium]